MIDQKFEASPLSGDPYWGPYNKLPGAVTPEQLELLKNPITAIGYRHDKDYDNASKASPQYQDALFEAADKKMNRKIDLAYKEGKITTREYAISKMMIGKGKPSSYYYHFLLARNDGTGKRMSKLSTVVKKARPLLAKALNKSFKRGYTYH